MMSQDQIDALVVGATLYHQLAPGSPQGEGQAVFYFAPGGRAAARLPSGKIMVGDYVIEDGGYKLNWDGGLQNSRSTLTKEVGALVCRNAVDQQMRSTVTKIVFGDAERIGV